MPTLSLLLASVSKAPQEPPTFNILPTPVLVAVYPFPKTSIRPTLFRQTQADSLSLPSQTSIREYILHAHFLPMNGPADFGGPSVVAMAHGRLRLKVDPSGTGSNFVAAQMVVNGDAVHAVNRSPYPRTDCQP